MSDDLQPAARLPMLVLGMACLVAGVLAGLARLGVAVPTGAGQAGVHAALLIAAFFGTVISLERAVALARRWAYLAPAGAGAAGVALLVGAPVVLAQAVLVGAASVMVLASVRIMQRQAVLFTVMLLVGAVSWLVGNLVWAVSGSVQAAVPWWLAFLVLTIAGERLELSRFLPRKPAAAPMFVVITLAIVAGAGIAMWHEAFGLRLYGAALAALAIWLLTYDIARRNARRQGLARFIAICLLSGYAWLALGGLLGVTGALSPGHPLRDAALHAIALGFVFGMVFGHAPIIFPAVMRVRIPYHAVFYVPLAVLHASLALRVGGALAESFAARQHGALVNALALLLFVVTMLASVYRGRRAGGSNASNASRSSH